MEEHYVEIQRITLLDEKVPMGTFVLKSVIEKYYDVGFKLIGNYINPQEPNVLNLIFIRKEK
jgi:hypothetical protein